VIEDGSRHRMPFSEWCIGADDVCSPAIVGEEQPYEFEWTEIGAELEVKYDIYRHNVEHGEQETRR
jgi:hypothetical protein